MSNPAFNPNRYAGKFANDIMAQTIASNETVGRELVDVRANVKSKISLPDAELQMVLEDESCEFGNGANTATIGETVFEPATIETKMEICYKDFRGTWTEEELRPGANNGNIPPTVESWLLDYHRRTLGSSLEGLIWNGKNQAYMPKGVSLGFSEPVTGLIPGLLAGSTKQAVPSKFVATTGVASGSGKVTVTANAHGFKPGNSVTFTGTDGDLTINGFPLLNGTFQVTKVLTANTFEIAGTIGGAVNATTGLIYGFTRETIISDLETALSLVPTDVLASETFKLHVSYKTLQLFNFALSVNMGGAGGLEPNRQSARYQNYEIVAIPRYPENTIVAARKENLVVATDLIGDANSVELIDMRVVGDDKMRMKSRFRVEAKPRIPQDCSIISPLATV